MIMKMKQNRKRIISIFFYWDGGTSAGRPVVNAGGQPCLFMYFAQE